MTMFFHSIAWGQKLKMMFDSLLDRMEKSIYYGKLGLFLLLFICYHVRSTCSFVNKVLMPLFSASLSWLREDSCH